MEPIAYIRTDFPEKFGIPRQSGIIEELEGTIIFKEKYRNPEALRGLEGFSHIWLIWLFSGCSRDSFQATVRPPRLGGKTRLGVFATRSPFRPNPIGLSCVRLEGLVQLPGYGTVLKVRGADLKDRTEILDIKPYIPFSDSRPDASSGFIETAPWQELEVNIPPALIPLIPADKLSALIQVLKCDPRSSDKKNSGKSSGLSFAGMNIRFSVENNLLTVTSVERL